MQNVDVKNFEKDGYLVFESFLSDEESQKLVLEINENQENETLPLSFHDNHAQLISNNKVMNIVSSIMGESRFHHLHSAVHYAGMKSMGWHHDHELQENNQQHKMLHFLFYLSGLNGEIGDLLVVPGSHNNKIKSRLFFKENLNFFKHRVIDNLKPGSLVVINSALVHARQAKPGGQNSPRYFIDLSYCQASTKWPEYLGRNDWGTVKGRLKKWNLNSEYEYIFKTDCFYLPYYDYILSRLKNYLIPKYSAIRNYLK